MKYVIWGAGARGGRVFQHLKDEEVIAFIDQDKEKKGMMYYGKPIIDIEEYKERYNECFIIISNLREEEVINELVDNNIYTYFRLSECPGEFQEPVPRDLLKKYVKNDISGNLEYMIYGITLYSLEVYKWISEELNKKVILVPHQSVEKKKLEEVSKRFRVEGLKKDVDRILVTVEEDLEVLYKCDIDKEKIKNIYDCSDNIEEYFNPKLTAYKDKHKNKRCFIVGTGPSLRMEDLECLYSNQEICISVNRIFNSFDKTKWRPDYFLATDYEFVKDGEILNKVRNSQIFISDCCGEFWEKNKDMTIEKFHTQYEMYAKRLPKFSSDFSKKSYLGGTVVYACMQLAVYMGCSEIYLLGVDCNYKRNSNENYFFSTGNIDTMDHGVDYMLLAFQSAKQYADSHNIKIYNATRGGMLEVFERADFDSLFE